MIKIGLKIKQNQSEAEVQPQLMGHSKAMPSKCNYGVKGPAQLMGHAKAMPSKRNYGMNGGPAQLMGHAKAMPSKYNYGMNGNGPGLN
jgi:hypothetical protein